MSLIINRVSKLDIFWSVLKNKYYIKNLGLKDGTIVPGQVELNGPSTLVRGSYPQ